MTSDSRLRVAIDARVTPQVWGGVAHALKGLLQGLSALDGDEQYVVIVSDDDQREWIAPHLGPNQTLVDMRHWTARQPVSRPHQAPLAARAGLRVKGLARAAASRMLNRLRTNAPQWPQVMVSDGFFESLDCEVMHFPTQRFVLCAMPSVYNPHDLQHLHYPQFFTAWEIAQRDVMYRHACQTARCVMVGSEWVKNDVVSSFGVDTRRVQVIPEGAPTQFLQQPTETALHAFRTKFAVPEPFLLFPAMTWPHKNHLRLFEAMRLYMDRTGSVVHLACTGARYERYWPRLEAGMDALGLRAHVHFLGYLSDEELTAAYTLAHALVMPSLFEASSLPIFEAWQAGVPVATSNATALPEQVADAALLFDPMDVSDMAEQLQRIMSDQSLRSNLVRRGSERLRDFDWRQTATAYRAVYRRTAARTLSDEDRWLLSWSSMRDAGSKPPRETSAHTQGTGARA